MKSDKGCVGRWGWMDVSDIGLSQRRLRFVSCLLPVLNIQFQWSPGSYGQAQQQPDHLKR